jgi:TrmH family RNA methyltransferase
MRPLLDGRHRTSLIISRRTHPLIKELRELRDHPHNDLLFLEGPRLLEEVLKTTLAIRTLIVSDKFKGSSELLGRAKARAEVTFTVEDSIFPSFSDVEEPQGLLAIGLRPRWSWDSIVERSPAPVIILEGLQNPGNIAAIARTAEAAGAAGIVTTPGTVHLGSPKALRGAMGSSLRLPSLEHIAIEEITDRLPRAGYRIYGTSADLGHKNSVLYNEVDWTHASAVVLGHEGGGLSKAWSSFIHQSITIPMHKPVESLNVAAAAAILLYESLRQRQASPPSPLPTGEGRKKPSPIRRGGTAEGGG